jgi:DNA polymerase III gamma/tau subunit
VADTHKPQEQKTPAFRHILGQERVLSYLRTALKVGRLAHAYLFLGPEGVGKATTARALAAALNCEAARADGDACGTCPVLPAPGRGQPPGLCGDPAHLRRERPPKIKIEQIREFRKLTAYPPMAVVAGEWPSSSPAEDMTSRGGQLPS